MKSVEAWPSMQAMPRACIEPGHVDRMQRLISHHSLTTRLVNHVRAFINDPATKDTFRGLPRDFTRDRCFTFPVTCFSILKEHSRSSQTRVLHLFQDGAFGARNTCPTASAFFQAREKVLPGIFQELTRQAVQFYYANFPQESLVTTWRGMRVWAVDCTRINLPDNDETRYFYSIQPNQHVDGETVCGLASFTYDVLNDLPTNACLEKVQAEKQLLFQHHFTHFTGDTIVLYDRGYADYAVIASHVARGIPCVIRMPIASTFKVVKAFMGDDRQDTIVTLTASKRTRRGVKAGIYPAKITVRLVKIMLPTSEKEVLMTNLLDCKKYKTADFKWLYGKRWGVETGFNRFKNHLEAECFSSGKVHNIKQDFHAMVFMQVLEAVMNKPHDRQIRADSMHHSLQHVYHVNKAGAYTILSDHLVGLFILDESTMLRHLERYMNSINLFKSPIRPNRHDKREELTDARRLRYHVYRKKRR
ncbi:MAG: IS4 family transposase [Candidatus Sigynarchaeota archaeon]